jgi:hypothetical protein
MNLSKLQREIERERLRRAMPWASDRQIKNRLDTLIGRRAHYAATAVGYASAGIATERARMGRSDCVWKNFPWLRMIESNRYGGAVFTDFVTFNGTAVASNVGNYWFDGGGFTTWEDTSGSVATLATDFPLSTITNSTYPPATGLAFGAIELATVATINKGITAQFGGGANGASNHGMFAVPPNVIVTSPSTGQLPKLYFEARVRFPQNANLTMVLGLATPGKTASANGIIASGSALAANNAIGFAITSLASTGFATSLTAIQPFYGSSGGAFTVANQTGFVGSVGGIPSTASYIGATQSPVVAGVLTDWTKLGFVFDPSQPTALQYFQDGVLLAQQTISQLVAANWPSFAQLTPTIAIQSSLASTAVKLDVDWIGIAQVIDIE